MAGKRKIEAEVQITATDDASKAIERLEQRIDGLEADEARITVTAQTEKLEGQLDRARQKLDGLEGDEASVQLRLVGNIEQDLDDARALLRQLDGQTGTVSVEADTKDAQRSIEDLIDDVEGLTEGTKELRIEYRAEKLRRDIAKLTADLDVITDPIDIRVRTQELEDAQAELRRLGSLASERLNVDIDVSTDSIRRAAGDIDRLRGAGDGFQSALPALRGFTDELGSTAQAAGVTGQAIGDLGDLSLILGEKFGLASGTTAALGTALGAAGIASVALIPLFQALTAAQDDQIASAETLRDINEALFDQEFQRAAQALVDTYSDLIAEGVRLGFTEKQIVDFLTGTTDALGSRKTSQDEAYESSRDFVNQLARERTALGLSGVDLDRNRRLVELVAGNYTDAASAIRSFNEEGADGLPASVEDIEAVNRKFDEQRLSVARSEESVAQLILALRNLDDVGLEAFAASIGAAFQEFELLDEAARDRVINGALSDLGDLLANGFEVDDSILLLNERLPKLEEYADSQDEAAGEVLRIFQTLAPAIGRALTEAASEGTSEYLTEVENQKATIERVLADFLPEERVRSLLPDIFKLLELDADTVDLNYNLAVDASVTAQAEALLALLAAREGKGDEALVLQVLLDAGAISADQAKAAVYAEIGEELPWLVDLLPPPPEDLEALPRELQRYLDNRGSVRAAVDPILGDTTQIDDEFARLRSGVDVPVRFAYTNPFGTAGAFTAEGFRNPQYQQPSQVNIFNGPTSPRVAADDGRIYESRNGSRSYL